MNKHPVKVVKAKSANSLLCARIHEGYHVCQLTFFWKVENQQATTNTMPRITKPSERRM